MVVIADSLPPVVMPQLIGGRERARKLLEPTRGRIRGRVVRLDCRQLVAGTPSFADEMVKAVLVEEQAEKLVVEYAAGTFAEYMRAAAMDHGVTAMVEFI